MKHFSLYILLLLVGLTTACKKDSSKPDDIIVDNRPPAEVVETLTEKLESVEDISTFTNSLKNVSLSKEDVSQGLTIFAPLDQTSSGSPQQVNRLSPNSLTASTTPQKIADVSAGDPAPALTDKELKDHIVKGVLKLADLVNGMTLTSLSGKALKITREGNQVFVNGVQLGNAVSSDGKQTVFIVNKPLSNTTVTDPPSLAGSIEVTIWDVTKWASGKPKGEVAPSVEVALYHSQKDYADNKIAYKALTGVDGKVKFNNVTPGTYYVVATMGDLTNIFYKSTQKVDGVYIGMASESVFQSQTDVENSPIQTGNDARIGNFKWIDLNADGIVNNGDLTALPHQSGIVETSKNIEVSVLIGYPNNAAMLPLDESGILAFLAMAEEGVSVFHKQMVMIDGVLGDDDVHPMFVESQPYASINNFSFNAANDLIRGSWLNAYDIISKLNKLIRDIKDVTMVNQDAVLAQARGLRAYVYMQLYTYFGLVPLQFDVNLPSNAVNAPKAGILNFIHDEFNAIDGSLPEASGSKGKLTRYSVYALKAKIALLDKNYQMAADLTDQVLSSGSYQLASNASIFDSNSPETMWLNSPYPNMFLPYFDNPNCPYIRLTEVYLISAEAHLESGNIQMAINSLNPVLNRMGKPTISLGATTEGIRSTLRETWKEAMPREGTRFANLVRWGLAPAALQSSGYQAGKHNLLPIPQVVIDQYSNIMQNPGY